MSGHNNRMKLAGSTLSRILTQNGIEHAFIGGFALNVLGSHRETQDIDVEIAVDDIHELRGRVTRILREADSRFVVKSPHNKLFFVMDDVEVPIETLPRGSLNLPRRLVVFRPGDGTIPVLVPGVLVLTKMKRAANFIGSTRPQSRAKYDSDCIDILYLLGWLRKYNQKIDFANYDAAKPESVYAGLRNIRTHWAAQGQDNAFQLLDSLLQPNDREIIVGN